MTAEDSESELGPRRARLRRSPKRTQTLLIAIDPSVSLRGSELFGFGKKKKDSDDGF
jgi:hypothetical protein